MAMMASPQRPRQVLRRALQNAGLLSSGQLIAGLMQLATFALAARGLGLAGFGLFSMLLAQVQIVIELASFKFNQAVISYGVGHFQRNDMKAFQALLKIGLLIDVIAAFLVMIVTIIGAPLIGEELGWDQDLIRDARLISLLAFANLNATPKGMLRLFGRFDLLSLLAMVTPGGRLIGVGAAYALGASFTTYLIVWLIAGWLGAAVAQWLGFREAYRHGSLAGMTWSLRHLQRENEGIWRFTLVANLHSTMVIIPGHLATFLVGAMLDPSAAGLFKVAREVGSGIAKPVDLINQSVYPDIARLVQTNAWRRLKQTVISAGAVASGMSGVITVIIAIVGQALLALIFGPEFAMAQNLLLVMSLATTIMVMTFAVDPLMYAIGRPGRPLITSVVAAVCFTLVLWWRLPIDGLIGAGWAYLAMGLATVVVSTIWAVQSLAGRSR
jgi:O-antigen/teichoic acid export membrane protein